MERERERERESCDSVLRTVDCAVPPAPRGHVRQTPQQRTSPLLFEPEPLGRPRAHRLEHTERPALARRRDVRRRQRPSPPETRAVRPPTATVENARHDTETRPTTEASSAWLWYCVVVHGSRSIEGKEDLGQCTVIPAHAFGAGRCMHRLLLPLFFSKCPSPLPPRAPRPVGPEAPSAAPGRPPPHSPPLPPRGFRQKHRPKRLPARRRSASEVGGRAREVGGRGQEPSERSVVLGRPGAAPALDLA